MKQKQSARVLVLNFRLQTTLIEKKWKKNRYKFELIQMQYWMKNGQNKGL